MSLTTGRRMNEHSFTLWVFPAIHARVDKADAILRAATDVFADRGVFNAQAADIVRTAGVAAGTAYRRAGFSAVAVMDLFIHGARQR